MKVPPLLPRLWRSRRRVVHLVEDVIAAHLPNLFPGMDVGEHHVFRVTRDADLDVEEDEAGDLLEGIQTVLFRRRRGASCVRLEVEGETTDGWSELLCASSSSRRRRSTRATVPLDLGGLGMLESLDRPELKDEPGRR